MTIAKNCWFPQKWLVTKNQGVGEVEKQSKITQISKNGPP